MSLSPADQLTAIRANTFFTALKTQFQAIQAAMTTNAFNVEGWIVTEVAGVPVQGAFQPDGETISLNVGVDDNGQPFYTWNAPVGWIAP